MKYKDSYRECASNTQYVVNVINEGAAPSQPLSDQINTLQCAL